MKNQSHPSDKVHSVFKSIGSGLKALWGNKNEIIYGSAQVLDAYKNAKDEKGFDKKYLEGLREYAMEEELQRKENKTLYEIGKLAEQEKHAKYLLDIEKKSHDLSLKEKEKFLDESLEDRKFDREFKKLVHEKANNLDSYEKESQRIRINQATREIEKAEKLRAIDMEERLKLAEYEKAKHYKSLAFKNTEEERQFTLKKMGQELEHSSKIYTTDAHLMESQAAKQIQLAELQSRDRLEQQRMQNDILEKQAAKQIEQMRVESEHTHKYNQIYLEQQKIANALAIEQGNQENNKNDKYNARLLEATSLENDRQNRYNGRLVEQTQMENHRQTAYNNDLLKSQAQEYDHYNKFNEIQHKATVGFQERELGRMNQQDINQIAYTKALNDAYIDKLKVESSYQTSSNAAGLELLRLETAHQQKIKEMQQIEQQKQYEHILNKHTQDSSYSNKFYELETQRKAEDYKHLLHQMQQSFNEKHPEYAQMDMYKESLIKQKLAESQNRYNKFNLPVSRYGAEQFEKQQLSFHKTPASGIRPSSQNVDKIHLQMQLQKSQQKLYTLEMAVQQKERQMKDVFASVTAPERQLIESMASWLNSVQHYQNEYKIFKAVAIKVYGAKSQEVSHYMQNFTQIGEQVNNNFHQHFSNIQDNTKIQKVFDKLHQDFLMNEQLSHHQLKQNMPYNHTVGTYPISLSVEKVHDLNQQNVYNPYLKPQLTHPTSNHMNLEYES